MLETVSGSGFRLAMATLAMSLIASCGASPPDMANSIGPVAGGTLALGLQKGAALDIEFTTYPHAACTLRLVGAPAGIELPLNSDRLGRVNFRFEQPSAGDIADNDTFALECQTSDGNFRRDLFEVSSDATIRELSPLLTAKPDNSGTVLPPLTGDLAALSQTDLLARGYPARPDANVAPEEYSNWVRNVSRPIRLVPEDLAVVEGSYHNGGGSFNGTKSPATWSGYEINTPGANPYTTVAAGWVVPTVFANTPLTFDVRRSSLWAGLDGDGTDDIIQAGTRQNIAINPGHASTLEYYAFAETYPLFENRLLGVKVRPGDTMTITAFPCDATNTPTNNGAWACFNVIDNTNQTGFVGKFPLSGIAFFGKSMEWIIERTTIAGMNTHLADYNFAAATVFGYSYANGSPVAFHTLATDSPTNITMFEDTLTKKLSTASQVDAMHINFNFQASF